MKHVISDENRIKIEEAVKAAEKKTSAEIVPVIVGRSSTIGHVFPLLFLFLSCLFLLSPIWEGFNEIWGGATLQRIFSFVILFVFAWGLSRLKFVQRFCVSKADMEQQAAQRAELEYSQRVLSRTKDQTGVLLMISLLEKRSFLIAEKGVNEHFPEGTWEKALTKLSKLAHKEGIELAFCDALNDLSDQLSEKLPIQEDDTNEISNELIITES